MKIQSIAILGLFVVVPMLIIGTLHYTELYRFALAAKSNTVTVAILCTIVAAMIEFGVLAYQDNHGNGLSTPEKIGAVAKAFAAAALFATVLSSAEDLSGANDKALPTMPANAG